MTHTNKSWLHRIVFAMLVISNAWLATARADDVLDRDVHFHIAASPLSSALLEFSTQAGTQIAVADADVAALHSNGLEGDYRIREALGILLHDTGLEFTRVGAETIAIRRAPAGATVGSMISAGHAGAAADIPAAMARQPDPLMNENAPPEFPDVTVIAPRPPTDEELAGDSLYQFIVHHATVHYVNTGVTGSLTRWRGGRPQTICPVTLGLDAGYNGFVSARLRAVAANVGAPVHSDLQCQDNVRIVFTADPEKVMSDVYKWASSSLAIKYPNQPQKLLLNSSSHPIQGWYLTARGGNKILNTDARLIGRLELLPIWPLVIQSGLNGGGCCDSGVVSVIIVVDTTKVAGYTIGSIADYIAMLTLSVVQLPDHCDALPSILDLMAPSCGAHEKPAGITAGDLAFLKALYFRNGYGVTLSRDDIKMNMLHQFNRQ
jgi:hypothetical protein